jgi:hypothetical protein
MMSLARRLGCCLLMTATLSFSPALLLAQGLGTPPAEEEQGVAGSPVVPDIPVTPEAPPPETPPQQGGEVEQGFQYIKTPDSTYTATAPLRGLSCVVGVGSESACAVTFSSADEGGYPWTLVKCHPGDVSLKTFATLLEGKQQVQIFEAPPQLSARAQTRSINVKLVRVCRKPLSPGNSGKK